MALNDKTYNQDLHLAQHATPDPLQQEFIALHMYGKQRADYDSQACQQAITSDGQSITKLNNPATSHRDLRAATTADLSTDVQAVGDTHNPGDDRKNALLDRQIIAVDRRYLAAHTDRAGHNDLGATVRQDIEHEIKVRQQDIAYCDKDRTKDEPQYIAHDQSFIAALDSGNSKQAADLKQVLLSDRHRDAANEQRYITNNNDASATSNRIISGLVSKDVMRQFGQLHIVDS